MADEQIGRFRYAIRREDDSVVARVGDIDGFFIGTWTLESDHEEADGSNDWPDPLTVTLLDVDLVPAVEEAFRADGMELGNVYLDVLDQHGRRIGMYWLSSATVEPRHASITAWIPKYPHRDAGAVWEQWRDGLPTELNLWARMPGRREGWLEAVVHQETAMRRDERDTPRTEVVLDGRFITDLAGFYCALGEAVNGPGGYYGWNTMALLECLSHGFGTEGNYTLVWEHSAVAREHLAKIVDTGRGPQSYFDLLIDCFRYRNKEVVLQ